MLSPPDRCATALTFLPPAGLTSTYAAHVPTVPEANLHTSGKSCCRADSWLRSLYSTPFHFLRQLPRSTHRHRSSEPRLLYFVNLTSFLSISLDLTIR